MQKPLNSILGSVGLLKAARKLREKLFPTELEKRIRNLTEYRLNLRRIEMVLSTEDKHSRHWIYPRYDHGKYHEPAITNFFIDAIKPGFCVLDVGVNIGWFTCLAGLLAREGHVHSFEVDDRCLPLIEKNLALNHLDNVTVNVCAVSDHGGTEKIPVSSEPDAELMLEGPLRKARSGFREVPAITIDGYLEARNLKPDFIKIDVEGAELKVLRGMIETMKLPDLILLVELHVDNMRDHFDTDYREALKLLVDNGFALEEITSHRRSEERVLRPVDLSNSLKSNPMILCRKFPAKSPS